jgi:hypothetical protein
MLMKRHCRSLQRDLAGNGNPPNRRLADAFAELRQIQTAWRDVPVERRVPADDAPMGWVTYALRAK